MFHTDYTLGGIIKPPLGLLPNPAHWSRAGLAGQWIMNEGSGLYLNDTSGNGNDGTIVGADWVAGKNGSALKFISTNSDYVIATLDGTNLTQLSICFNFKTYGQVGSSVGVFQWANGLTSGTPFVLIQQPGNTDTLTFFIDSGYQITINITHNIWHYLSLVLDSTNLWTVYLDGVVEGTYQDDGSHTNQENAAAIYLGNGYSGYWDGGIDFCNIYSRALNPIEIQSLRMQPYAAWIPQRKYWVAAAGGQTISFIADIQGASATPSIAIKLARALLANITGTSTTPSITISTARALVADIQGASTTSSISAALSRALTANIVGSSTSSSITIKLARALIANIVGTSTTPSITISTVRTLIANIAGVSVTPSIDAKLARSFSANITGASTTPSVAAKLARALTANIVGTSDTPSITATIEGIISWVASIAGVSTTPSIDVNIARSLSAAIAGTSVTPSISVKIARALLADIQGTSVTPNDLVLLLTDLILIIDTTIESLTPVYTISSLTPVRTIEAV